VTTTNPSVRRRFVGAALRHYRGQLGLTVDEAADVLECDVSKISRIETGQRSIRGSELETLLDTYGVFGTEQRSLLALASVPGRGAGTWWHPFANALPPTFREYAGLEGQAERILLYSGTQVPELLQIRAYSRALLSADLSVYAGSEEMRVDAGYARRQAILEDRSANLEVILTEGALRQQVGDAEVMRAQLERLVELATGSRYPWVSLRIVPFAAGAVAAAGFGAFSVLHFKALSALGLVHLAGMDGSMCLEQPEDSFFYGTVFRQTQVKALTLTESYALLRRMAQE
jgi:transcriptional regulator with XRE-family HTH domain